MKIGAWVGDRHMVGPRSHITSGQYAAGGATAATNVLRLEVDQLRLRQQLLEGVEDLSRFDFDTTRRLAEFRVRVRDRIRRVRFGE